MKKLTKNQMEMLAEIKKGNVWESEEDKRSMNSLIKRGLVSLSPIRGTSDNQVSLSDEGKKYFPEETKVEEHDQNVPVETKVEEHDFDKPQHVKDEIVGVVNHTGWLHCLTCVEKLEVTGENVYINTAPHSTEKCDSCGKILSEDQNVSVEEKTEIKEEKTSNYPKARKVCLPTVYGDLYIFLKDETGNPIHKNFVILPTHKPDVAKYAIKNCYRNQDLPKPMLIEYSFHKLITSIFPTGRLNTSYFDLFDQMSKGVQIFGEDGLIKSDYYHWSERNGKPVDHDENRKPKPNQQLLEAEKELEDLISEVKNIDFESPNFCPDNFVSLTKALREQFKYVKVLKETQSQHVVYDIFGRLPFKVKVPGQTMFPVPNHADETS